MKSIFKYILKNALRDRLYIGVFLALALAFALSIFLGNTMLVEQQQSSAAFIAGSCRVIIVFGMILFVCLSVARAFENKEIEFILSKAISREKFILGYLGGFYIAALLILLVLALAIFVVTQSGLVASLVWLGSLTLEIFIVIAFALLTSLILKNPLAAIMASCGFYILSRLMGIFIISLQSTNNFILQQKPAQIVIKAISLIFPRLDLFAQSSWLNYGIADLQILNIIGLQSLIYIALLLFMSFYDFKQKQF
jgi:ABC-type transport system involved in multi-copper enzyme maturation permease subunit